MLQSERQDIQLRMQLLVCSRSQCACLWAIYLSRSATKKGVVAADQSDLWTPNCASANFCLEDTPNDTEYLPKSSLRTVCAVDSPNIMFSRPGVLSEDGRRTRTTRMAVVERFITCSDLIGDNARCSGNCLV